MVIVKNTLTSTEKYDHYKSYINDDAESLLRAEDIGVRNFAYEIKKNNQGRYLLFNFSADDKFLKSLDKKLRYDKEILRYLILRAEVSEVFLTAIDAEAESNLSNSDSHDAPSIEEDVAIGTNVLTESQESQESQVVSDTVDEISEDEDNIDSSDEESKSSSNSEND